MGIDGSDRGTTDRLLRPDSLRAMRSLGLTRLTYRLRTELGEEVWHWNPVGQWSDPAREEGYWTSSTTGMPVRRSWGYPLPRRGTTADQANNDGYSRLTDGDPATLWKSHPYLDARFTGDADRAHPQWVVVDLGKPCPVNAIRLHWANPYAVRYRVEYCVFEPETPVTGFADTFQEAARWEVFPHGSVERGEGGDVTLRLADRARRVRFVRIWLMRSSHTGPPGSREERDRLGYALREIEVGQALPRGGLADRIRHAPNARRQSRVFVSSTDPWHRAGKRDRDTEQPGIDAVVRADLNRSRPILMPMGLAYDTPENAAALLSYLRRRRVPVTQIELGEEPDGQFLSPEDYGALFLQWARALHAIDPQVRLGGPSLQTEIDGWQYWPAPDGDRSWMRRFLAYLRAHRALSTFAFFSFEWYPFDNLRPGPERQLREHGPLLEATLARLRAEGVPQTIPWILSEFGWSSYATQSGVDLPGGLLDAEIIARFLLRGGTTAYLYGAAPDILTCEPEARGSAWGGLGAFLRAADGQVLATLPTARTIRLLSQVWMQGDAAGRPHTLYAARAGNPAVFACALHRPDSRWALLLLNRDGHRSCRVRLPFAGSAEVWRYGPAQYHWQDAGPRGHPTRDFPPERSICRGVLTLPPFSLTVARWEDR